MGQDGLECSEVGDFDTPQEGQVGFFSFSPPHLGQVDFLDKELFDLSGEHEGQTDSELSFLFSVFGGGQVGHGPVAFPARQTGHPGVNPRSGLHSTGGGGGFGGGQKGQGVATFPEIQSGQPGSNPRPVARSGSDSSDPSSQTGQGSLSGFFCLGFPHIGQLFVFSIQIGQLCFGGGFCSRPQDEHVLCLSFPEAHFSQTVDSEVFLPLLLHDLQTFESDPDLDP